MKLAALLLLTLAACGQRREPAPAPNTEIDELRAADTTSLQAYEQLDKDGGTYQLPIARAIELMASNPALLEPLLELPDLDEMTPVQRGGYHFNNTYACAGCHAIDGTVKRAPALNGRWRGPPSQLTTGQSVAFDDAYFNESVLNSQAKIVKGFLPIMPLFAGRMPDRDLAEIRAYLKSL